MMSGKEVDPESCEGLLEHESDLSQHSDAVQTGFTNPACAVLVPEKIPQQDAGDSSPEPPPEVEVFNVKSWVSELNQTLLDHQRDAAAQTTLLTKAREMCDHHIQNLTGKFLQSESDLKVELKKHPNKKAQKKILRIFDPELRSINKEVDQMKQVKQQVEWRLLQVSTPALQGAPLTPILLAEEVKACARQPHKSKFCKDLMLCLLLSFLIFLLLYKLMKYPTFHIV